MRTYDYAVTIGFEETNLVGNVYFVNHLRWQGKCREMFLRDHAPGVIRDLAAGLRIMTVRCACEYHDELNAFDDVLVRMSLRALRQTSLGLSFDYVKRVDGRDVLVARGEQEIAFLRGGAAAPVPTELRDALRPFERE
jgi:enediyne biosynthesis thioesterase